MPTLTSSLCEYLRQENTPVGRCKAVNNNSFSNWSAPFQAADRQNEQGDAGDGRSVWPIRLLGGAGIWRFIGWDRRWAGPWQEEPPVYKEPHKWLGSGGAKWLVGIEISPGQETGSETGMSLFLVVKYQVVKYQKSLVLQYHVVFICSICRESVLAFHTYHPRKHVITKKSEIAIIKKA